MGSNFFKSSSPKIGAPSGASMTARALGSSVYKGRGDASGASKALNTALSSGKSKFKPQKTNSAYAKGPKI